MTFGSRNFPVVCFAAVVVGTFHNTRFVHGLQPKQQQQQQQQLDSTLNVAKLQKAIYEGRVYQEIDFLTEDQVQQVLSEISVLEQKGGFQRKGLSNTALQNNQTFDKKLDRSICPVPWFVDALEGKDKRVIPSKLQSLQLALSAALERPTMADPTLDHECYYSKSEVGSRLPRHMDERHEEMKGAKGWLQPSRRSLSWLIYLSDPKDWSLTKNGGALRSFPQKRVVPADATHDGNLQVGWLVDDDDDDRPSHPVYMDSWHLVKGTVVNDAQGSTLPPDPHCILYTTTTSDAITSSNKRTVLTRPWLTEQLQGMAVSEFLVAAARHDAAAAMATNERLLFLDATTARQFSPLEDRIAWDEGKDPMGSETVDITPLRGSLVVFDSVKLPHQVQLIKEGTRLALAGWFHERTQEFPEALFF